jgi:hypothetical protein
MAVQLVDDVTELLILCPHLGPALERDQGAADEERVTGSTTAGLPVNADVLEAIRILDADLLPLGVWAAGVVAERAPARDAETTLQHLPRLHERMLVTAAVAEAGQLAAGVHRILRRVKLALGLRTVDLSLGQFCPLHDDPLSELVAPGDEGTLTYRRLDQAGRPVAPTVTWRRSNSALCRRCGASWAPAQYLLLGKLLRDADARRLAATAGDQGAA